MIGDVYQFEDLQQLTERTTVRSVIARLDELGIEFQRFGRGKPWTTIQQINASVERKKPKYRRNKQTQSIEPVITVK